MDTATFLKFASLLIQLKQENRRLMKRAGLLSNTLLGGFGGAGLGALLNGGHAIVMHEDLNKAALHGAKAGALFGGLYGSGYHLLKRRMQKDIEDILRSPNKVSKIMANVNKHGGKRP